MKIPESKYKEIEELIGSEESVVGIDAKKTHIMIIYMLQQMQDQIDNLEDRIHEVESKLID